jgi:hypothetical protein
MALLNDLVSESGAGTAPRSTSTADEREASAV